MFKDPRIPKETTFKPICINENYYQDKVSDFIDPIRNWDHERLKGSVMEEDYDVIRRIPLNI